MAEQTYFSGSCLMVLEDRNQEVSLNTTIVPPEAYFGKLPEAISKYFFKIPVQPCPIFDLVHELYAKGWRRNLNRVVLLGDEVQPILVLIQQAFPYRFHFRRNKFYRMKFVSPCDIDLEMIVQPATETLCSKSIKLVWLVHFGKACWYEVRREIRQPDADTSCN